jgi:hypothetical protein
MPYPILSVPQYPDVPAGFAGVPSVAVNPSPAAVVAQSGGVGGINSSLSNIIAPGGVLAPSALAPQPAPAWGIYTMGGVSPALSPTSVFQLDKRADRRISDYPQEQGAFASYNKVYVPFAGRVRMTLEGSLAQRTAFLNALDAICDDVNLYALVMPEKVYQSCNVTHYDFVRSARTGATLLVVDVWVEEVRNSPTATFTNTFAPSGASSVNAGLVAAIDATTAQLTSFGTPANPGNTGNWLSQMFDF